MVSNQIKPNRTESNKTKQTIQGCHISARYMKCQSNMDLSMTGKESGGWEGQQQSIAALTGRSKQFTTMPSAMQGIQSTHIARPLQHAQLTAHFEIETSSAVLVIVFLMSLTPPVAFVITSVPFSTMVSDPLLIGSITSVASILGTEGSWSIVLFYCFFLLDAHLLSLLFSCIYRAETPDVHFKWLLNLLLTFNCSTIHGFL